MGLDFMLDDQLNLNIIEVNTNPCLETPCILLQRMIPEVIDQTLKLAVDPFLAAKEH
jgi:tubulin--tyrosine ligase